LNHLRLLSNVLTLIFAIQSLRFLSARTKIKLQTRKAKDGMDYITYCVSAELIMVIEM